MGAVLETPLPPPGDSLPLTWQWIGLILGFFGFAGFAIAISPFLYLFRSRPRLEFEWQALNTPEAHTLILFIMNPPVLRGFWAWLGIHRTEAHFTVWYWVTRRDDSQVMGAHYARVKWPHDSKDADETVHTLEAGFDGLICTLTLGSEDLGTIVQQRRRIPPQLSARLITGKYFANIVITERTKAYDLTRSFLVANDNSISWYGPVLHGLHKARPPK